MGSAPPPDPTPDAPLPASSPPRPALPPTTRLWVGLLLVIYALPQLLGGNLGSRRGVVARDDALSAAAFEKYVLAESETRRAFGIDALADLGGPSPALLGPGGQRDRALGSAVDLYHTLLREQKAPLLARRVFLLDHARGRPFDVGLFDRTLAPGLRALGTGEEAIVAERALWRDLYARKRVDPADLSDYERRLRGMGLRFLENRALYDLYTAAGDTERAAEFALRMNRASRQYLGVATGAGFLFLGGFLLGVVLLVMFLVSCFDNRWQRVRRVATQPQRLGWGELLDAFVFYLVLVRGVGLVVRLAASWFWSGQRPTAHVELALQAVVYIGTGLAALAYLRAAAARRGVTLADIGLTARGTLVGNIGYGIAGYCAILPLLLALRALAQLLFRHLPNTAPNPIMPLIVAERDLAWRLVIFVLVALAAPFFEELFFRGALFAGLRSRWGWVASSIVSALLFAVVHPPQDWLPIVGLGLGFAAMREMRQSLVPSITAHLLQNSITFFSLSMLFQSG